MLGHIHGQPGLHVAGPQAGHAWTRGGEKISGWQAGYVPHPLPRALYLRVLLGLQEAQLSGWIYMLQAFYESLITYPGTITNWEEKKGRKTREKRTHRPLYLPLDFLKFWSPVKKSEQVLE